MYVFKKQNPKQRYDAFLDGAYDMEVLKISHITPNIHQTKDMLHRMETINVKLVRKRTRIEVLANQWKCTWRGGFRI